MGLVNPFGVLQDILAALFYKYGLYVSSNPRPFILIPVLITFSLSFGVLAVHVQVGTERFSVFLQ